MVEYRSAFKFDLLTFRSLPGLWRFSRGSTAEAPVMKAVLGQILRRSTPGHGEAEEDELGRGDFVVQCSGGMPSLS